MLVNSDISTLSGGVPPVIKTKSATAATTAGANLVPLVAQNQQQLITMISNMHANMNTCC